MDMEMKDNLVGEVLSGVLAGLAVSPLAAMIEKAMFSSASGRMPYQTSIQQCAKKILISPVEFVRGRTFRLCFKMYASTFVTANCVDRIARIYDLNVNVTTFCAVTLVKLSLNLRKDTYLTKMFSLEKIRGRSVTRSTLVCYAIRDMITIVGAFVCIEPVAARIQKYVYIYPAAKLMSQTVCPMASQILSTPFFLLGIHLYNRPKASIWSRLWHVKTFYWDTYNASRVTRVGPVYSIGGILNIIFRFCFTQSILVKKREEREDDEDDDENLFNPLGLKSHVR